MSSCLRLTHSQPLCTCAGLRQAQAAAPGGKACGRRSKSCEHCEQGWAQDFKSSPLPSLPAWSRPHENSSHRTCRATANRPMRLLLATPADKPPVRFPAEVIHLCGGAGLGPHPTETEQKWRLSAFATLSIKAPCDLDDAGSRSCAPPYSKDEGESSFNEQIRKI